jgi:hypothetical protein
MKLILYYNLMMNLYYCYLIPYSLRTVYFAHFQSLLQFEIIFCNSPTNLQKAHIEQKRKMRVILGLRQRLSCGQKFKKLQIVTVPMLYILETVMFVVKNSDKYQTNVSDHSRDMRQIS